MTFEMPKRLSPPAPYGALLKRAPDQPKRRAFKAEQAEDAAHLALVRQMPCLYCGVEPCGEAAHVKQASAAHGKSLRFGKRPEDRWALPLCRDDHQNARHAQHKGSEVAFWDALGIAPLPLCEKLYAARGDYERMRAIVLLAIAALQKDAPIGTGCWT